MSEIVAIIGASDRKDRYAYLAMKSLLQKGHDIRLVNPLKEQIEDFKCYKSLSDIKEKIHTVTLYVNPQRFKDHIDDVIRIRPARVIMNPGTEDDAAQEILEKAGIEVSRACTLVLLSTGQFWRNQWPASIKND